LHSLKELQEQGLDASSSSEEEDETAELITPKLDLQILQTLQRYLLIQALVQWHTASTALLLFLCEIGD
jgi:hypothetical protein